MDSSFPASFRKRIRDLGILNRWSTSETRVRPDRITSTNGRSVNGLWVDIFGIHSPISLPHILYLHGGGYIAGDPHSYVATATTNTIQQGFFFVNTTFFFFDYAKRYTGFVSKLVHGVKARSLVVDYTLRPEGTLDQALDDAVAAYEHLLKNGVDPRQIVIAGDSAGGNLAIMTALALKTRGIQLPSGLALLSPWGDLTFSPELRSHIDNEPTDGIFTTEFASSMAKFVVAGDQETGKRFSPSLFPSDTFKGLPPTLVLFSTTELLADDSTTLISSLKKAGVSVSVESDHHVPHVYPLSSEFLPQSLQGLNAVISFISRYARHLHSF